MTTRPSIRPEVDERGFLLVGVIMFVFVLTILGLSLFSLSGYESQFMFASVRRSESFYAASSGIERARFVMTSGRPMADVGDYLPPGVIHSVAYIEGVGGVQDSTGPVGWSTNPTVTIRSTADVRGEVTTLERRFIGSEPENIYRRLFTLSEGFDATAFDLENGVVDTVFRNVGLGGAIWAKNPTRDVNFPATYDTVQTLLGFSFQQKPAAQVPQPNVGSYITQHRPTATRVTPANPDRYTLSGSILPGDPPAFYYTDGLDTRQGTSETWSLDTRNPNPEVSVGGVCVWMFERGVRFQDQVRIRGTVPLRSVLILVASNSLPLSGEPFTGISFNGAVDSDIPIILVTNGRVNIEHDVSNTVSSSIPWLSVYAQSALLMGPRRPRQMTLYHPTNFLPSFLDPLLDALTEAGLLPGTDAGTPRKLDPIAGTWRDLSHPD